MLSCTIPVVLGFLSNCIPLCVGHGGIPIHKGGGHHISLGHIPRIEVPRLPAAPPHVSLPKIDHPARIPHVETPNPVKIPSESHKVFESGSSRPIGNNFKVEGDHSNHQSFNGNSGNSQRGERPNIGDRKIDNHHIDAGNHGETDRRIDHHNIDAGNHRESDRKVDSHNTDAGSHRETDRRIDNHKIDSGNHGQTNRHESEIGRPNVENKNGENHGNIDRFDITNSERGKEGDTHNNEGPTVRGGHHNENRNNHGGGNREREHSGKHDNNRQTENRGKANSGGGHSFHHNHRQLKPHELPGDKDDHESVKQEFLKFREAHDVKGHHFKSEQDQQQRMRRYEEHRKRVKEHNRLYDSGQQTFRIKMHEYSDEDLQTLVKQRDGFHSANLPIRRLEAAPPVNMNRHRGSLRKLRRAKRQFSLQQLLSLFQSLSSGRLPSFPGIPGIPVGPVSPGGNGAHKAPVYPTGPDSLDWRLHDYVTSVKDQNGAIEGQMAACHGDHTSLSEQNILDCAGSYGVGACDGGDPAKVFKYAKDHGVEPESVYPYTSKNTAVNRGTCRQNPNLANNNSFVDTYDALPEGDEISLRNALHVGPISVCISASSAQFQSYSDGVFDYPSCSKNVDHAVLLVGYGTDEKAGDYWVVKNSWGPNWGEDGYIRMKRNAGNQCGIANYAIYPNLKGCT